MKAKKLLLITCALIGLYSCKKISYSEKVKDCQRKISTLQFDLGCLNGAQLPEFSIFDVDSQLISNHNIRGNLTLLNFWFIECPPCVEELPSLAKLNSLFEKSKFEIISICRNSQEELEYFMEDNPIPYRVAGNGREVIEEIFQNPFGYPVNILIDEDGKIINTYRALLEKHSSGQYERLIENVKDNI